MVLIYASTTLLDFKMMHRLRSSSIKVSAYIYYDAQEYWKKIL